MNYTGEITEKTKRNIDKHPKCFIVFFTLILFFCGFFVGKSIYKNKTANFKPVRQNGFTFTSPLLECESEESGSSLLFSKKIEDGASESIEKSVSDKDVDYVSVYFRDLKDGPWFGINEQIKFTPASLLKVPLMMAYFKKAEDKPEILSEKFVYNGSNNNDVFANIEPEKKLERGGTYTIEEAIEIMVENSDNNAANFLLEKIDQDTLDKVYSDLSLEAPTAEKTENFMTVKTYASFFRILFNASYLDREMSEKALLFLSKSSFKDGLVSQLSQDIKISHKFGERKENGVLQLHDCGIVYYPNHPYVLCIMTKGNDFKKLESTIGSLSKVIYYEIDK